MKNTEKQTKKISPVYIVDGARSPQLKARLGRGPFSASDLAVYAGRELLSRQPFAPTDIGEVVVGCMMPSEDEANIGRIIGLRLGCGQNVPGWTVQRNCASGMQALDSAIKDISMGRHDIVLAGGTEAMSRAPVLFRPAMVNWLAKLNASKTFTAKMGMLPKFRFHYLLPIISLIRGLSDPLYGVNMGQTAEILAYQFGITRNMMDEYAMRSHERLINAQDKNLLTEVVTLYDEKGNFYEHDDGVRRDTTLEKLAKLKPFFDRRYGMVTAGNSSQVTDGAALLILAGEEAVKKYKLNVLAKIVDTQWAALNPEVMGLGPVLATTPLMQRHKLTFDDIDFVELNEAFAAQVLGCLAAWESKEFCQQHFGLKQPFGSLDQNKLNVDGGAIAIGHPVGATGARIVLHLVNILKRNNAKRGIATLCIGGGQGGAMLIET